MPMSAADASVPITAKHRIGVTLQKKSDLLRWKPELKIIGGRRPTKKSSGEKFFNGDNVCALSSDMIAPASMPRMMMTPTSGRWCISFG